MSVSQCTPNPCLPNPCDYLGDCDVFDATVDLRYGVYSAVCNCIPEFTGERCENGPCDNYPLANDTFGDEYCLHGSVCSNQISGTGALVQGVAVCDCTDTDYEGDRCDDTPSVLGDGDAQTDSGNDSKEGGVAGAVKSSPVAVVAVAAALIALIGILLIVAVKRWRRKEEPDEDELREEGQRAQKQDMQRIQADQHNRNSTWTSIGPTPPPATASGIQPDWQ